VFGYAFGGLLNIRGVVGCCIECKRELIRHIGGLGIIRDIPDEEWALLSDSQSVSFSIGLDNFNVTFEFALSPSEQKNTPPENFSPKKAGLLTNDAVYK